MGLCPQSGQSRGRAHHLVQMQEDLQNVRPRGILWLGTSRHPRDQGQEAVLRKSNPHLTPFSFKALVDDQTS